MIIDFHNHFYPPEYIEAIQKGPSNVKVTFDEDNNPLLHYPGDYNILVPEHRKMSRPNPRGLFIKSADIK